MQDDSPNIILDWLLPGAEAPAVLQGRVWTHEMAAAKLNAAREAAKSAHAAAEAMQGLEYDGENLRNAEKNVLMAMRYLRQAYKALSKPL